MMEKAQLIEYIQGLDEHEIMNIQLQVELGKHEYEPEIGFDGRPRFHIPDVFISSALNIRIDMKHKVR